MALRSQFWPVTTWRDRSARFNITSGKHVRGRVGTPMTIVDNSIVTHSYRDIVVCEETRLPGRVFIPHSTSVSRAFPSWQNELPYFVAVYLLDTIFLQKTSHDFLHTVFIWRFLHYVTLSKC